MPDVLDHGYVTVIEHWGSDERVIESARMSTAKGFLGWGPVNCSRCGISPTDNRVTPGGCTNGQDHDFRGDEKLLAYLWTHKHHTPFEMAGLTLEIQAPIFVFREWHRHRTQSYNELSARYTQLPDVNYVPTVDRILQKGGSNRQAQSVSGRPVTEDEAQAWIAQLEASYRLTQGLYRAGLDWGIPKELARLPVPVGRYSRMRASANLRNWLAFLTLRMDPAAQWEIQQYANVVADIVRQHFPRTYTLFSEGR